MKIFYRISDAGYKKVKPDYISNENCLKNFTRVFANYIDDIHITADNVSEETYNIICKYVNSNNIDRVSVGHGAGTFNLTLSNALSYDNDEIIYFVENDYLHKTGSPEILLEGINLGASYVTLYDHPDKYLNAEQGGNPFCTDFSEITRLYVTKSCHWKLTNSTTMTFCSTVQQLKNDETTIRKYTAGNHPHDFQMFLDILGIHPKRNNNNRLISCVPAYATHGETQWLAPLVDWSKI